MDFLSEQFPLELQLRDESTFDNFYLAKNALLVNQLRNQLEDGERYIYIYGASGCGRSHLLQAACHKADQLKVSAVYFPLKELQNYDADQVFDGLEHLSLVCLDDIQSVVANQSWERPLFHLFNRLAEHDIQLIIAGNCAVRELKVELKDLASRLSWGSLYHVKALTDQQRIEMFQFRAAKRGLEINDEVAQFIYRRCPRDTKWLLPVLDRLDKASLKEQRRITVPFVKSSMAW